MAPTSRAIEAAQAYRTLFGAHAPAPRSLEHLTPESVKRAFRSRAFELHPDRAAALGVNRESLTSRFQELSSAYEVLLAFTAPAERPQLRPEPAVSDTRWRGALPRRRLQLGEWLYYSGQISFHELTSALAWQRRQRPLMGQLAIDRGLLSHQQVVDLLKHVGRGQRFGDLAVQRGCLGEADRQRLLTEQRCRQRKLGEYFVGLGRIANTDLERELARQRQHNTSYAA